MSNYTLGGYTFEINPGEMDIPESKKTVAESPTYSGSAVFQWGALITGQSITLKWNAITTAMYDQLRALYLSTDEVSFDPDGAYIYDVLVTDLTAKYFKYYSGDFQYMKDVALTLNIRDYDAVS